MCRVLRGDKGLLHPSLAPFPCSRRCCMCRCSLNMLNEITALFGLPVFLWSPTYYRLYQVPKDTHYLSRHGVRSSTSKVPIRKGTRVLFYFPTVRALRLLTSRLDAFLPNSGRSAVHRYAARSLGRSLGTSLLKFSISEHDAPVICFKGCILFECGVSTYSAYGSWRSYLNSYR